MRAFIAGTSLIGSHLFAEWDEQIVETPYGKVAVRRAYDNIFLSRHGKKNSPPHKINHHANVWALKSLGAGEIIAINSVGSLKFNLKPGSFLIPDDFFCPWSIPTFFDHEARYTIPSMDTLLAGRLHKVCRGIGMDVILGGVYVQTTGPRFETRAEINALKKTGDVVGMTMASEITLCMEQTIPYASLCSIDNYGNGIIKAPLSMKEVEEHIERNRGTVEMVLHTILGEGL